MKMTLDKNEKEFLNSFEKGEWKRVKTFEEEKKKSMTYARETFKKDKRLNIRLSSRDFDGIRHIAMDEGLPYQTLIASILHKFVAGHSHQH